MPIERRACRFQIGDTNDGSNVNIAWVQYHGELWILLTFLYLLFAARHIVTYPSVLTTCSYPLHTNQTISFCIHNIHVFQQTKSGMSENIQSCVWNGSWPSSPQGIVNFYVYVLALVSHHVIVYGSAVTSMKNVGVGFRYLKPARSWGYPWVLLIILW